MTMKDFLPNFFEGFSLLKGNKIKEGDFVKIKQMEGKVVKINITNIEIESKGDLIYIPNSLFAKNEYSIKRKK